MAVAVASTSSNEKTEPPCIESFPSSPLISKPGSEYGGSEHSSELVKSSHIDASDQSCQSDTPRKDVDTQSPEYLKSEEYRMLFRLPPDETLVQDFNCAFQESILLQGHMYLFVRHICFYSNIFGFETKKMIHFNEITCVRKAKTAGIFPNAIEIVAGAKKYFFGSFLSRDEAYRLIVDEWSEHTDGTEVLIDHQELKSEIRCEDNESVTVKKVKHSELESNDSHPSDRYRDDELSGVPKLLFREDEVTISSSLVTQENGEEDPEPVVNDDHLSCRESLIWKVEDADAPKVPVYYTKVAESKFRVQVEEFFNLFFSDKAIDFIDMFHTISGDKDFRCTSWSAHEQFGHTRQVSFQHPIKFYFGAKFGGCNEVQKFRVYRNSHLVIETSQEVSDVPYADYFQVEGLWVVERAGFDTNNGCILRVYTNVAFSKKTMWKGKIEQSTIDECREAYALWIKNAHELLKKKHLEKPGEVSTLVTGPSEAQCEERQEREESSLQRVEDEATNVLQIPLVTSDTTIENPEVGGFRVAPLIRESLGRFSLYLKTQSHLSLVLVIAAVLILLMQLSIIVLLSRGPQVHLMSQVDQVYSGTSRNDMAEAEAWLERRFEYLKDEMQMVEARLEKMRHEHASLKEHFHGLERLRKKSRR